MSKLSSNQITEKIAYKELEEKVKTRFNTMLDMIYELYSITDTFGIKYNQLQHEVEDLQALFTTGKVHISHYVKELDLEELLKYSTSQYMENISEQAMKACTNEVTPNGLAETVSDTDKKRKAPAKKTKSVRKSNNRK
jgi:uncharacterized protein YlxW (UPF0749 family)